MSKQASRTAKQMITGGATLCVLGIALWIAAKAVPGSQLPWVVVGGTLVTSGFVFLNAGRILQILAPDADAEADSTDQ